MVRYFIDISYDGTPYHGWQIQNNAPTVQAELNQVLSTILRKTISSVGSGRTDKGVHAYMQVIHFDYDKPVNCEKLVKRLNSFLPKQVAVRSIRRVKKDVSARFDANCRAYIYKIHFNKNPFLENKSYLHTRILDSESMNQCCEVVKKQTDFQAMSKVKTEVNNFECEIADAKWEKENDGIHFSVSANRFLRGMVRILVGTMLEVGEGKKNVEDFKSILDSKDRKRAGRSVPAHGLYLRDITYPSDIYL